MNSVEVVDLEARAARVIVPDYQLSLAIGREGQNARLAARLTGWRIDIRGDGGGDPRSDDALQVAATPVPGHVLVRATRRREQAPIARPVDGHEAPTAPAEG